jgi:peroxiredoxin (alkyl hydroperoxide reductase subunit C)
MTIKVGDKVPAVTFMQMTPSGPQPITSDEVFAHKTVALFGVPGAFTPTCSAKHLPGFLVQSDNLLAKGVDTIACVSVNDPFVMGAWAKDQDVGDKVLMLADGSATFARAAGLDLDLGERGLGIRSKRFSALVVDGAVKILNLEQATGFEVSSAEALLAQI